MENTNNMMNNIDKAWDILMASKTNVRVAVQVSPAVRVAIGEEFGLRKGEDALGKLTTALRVLGVDLVVDAAIAEDALAYELACEVKNRKENGGKLPVIYSKKFAWTKKALENADLAEYVVTPRPALQALAVQIKKMFLGDGKRTFVISVVSCLGKQKAVEGVGLRQGDLPAADLALTTVELADILRSADLDLKYIPASPCDEPFGVASGCGYIADIGGGFAESVMRSLAADQSADGIRRIEYSGVRGNKAVRIGYGDVKTMVVAGEENANQMAADVLAGVVNCDFVEVLGNPLACAAGGGQPEADDNTKRLRAYSLYCMDKRSEVRVPAASEDTVALAAAFALDRADDGFVEAEVSLSPFDEEATVTETVAEEVVEEVIEEPIVEEVVEEVIEEPIVEEVVEEVIEEPVVEEVVEEVIEEPIVEEVVEEVIEEPIVEEVVEEVIEEPIVEEVVEEVIEEPIAEEVVEEAIEEPVVEEVVEEVIEEPIVEEVVEEVIEEPVAQEVVEEVIEEPVAEEVVEEVVEEPVAQEVVEEVIEEPVAQEVVEEVIEEPVVEEAVEEVAAAEAQEEAVAEEGEAADEEAQESEETASKYHPNYRRMSKTERRKLKRAKNKK